MTRALFMAFASALVGLTGCHPEAARRQELLRRTDELYAIYLNGTREDARRSIVEANRLIEQASFSDWEEHRANALFLGYGRLYSIDHRAGSNDLAQVDFIKAQYWALKGSEFHGDTESETDRYVEKFAGDGDKLLAFIDRWERGANHGKDPRYITQPYPGELSGGEQQRVSIARALAVEPKALLLDEPTSGLDPLAAGELSELLLQLRAEGGSFLIVSHQIDLLRRMCDRVYFLHKGRVLESGLANEVLTNPRTHELTDFISKVRLGW